MPQSLAAVYVHIVFSTKDRRALLRDPDLRTRLHEYLGGISKSFGCAPIRVGGVDDHVHVLGRLGRTITLADWVKELKRASNVWLAEQEVAEFRWQGGYACFSVSQTNLARATEYVANQEEHHKAVSFQDELRDLLSKHHIDFDERYVWD